MKKCMIMSLCALLMLSGCGTGTHAEQGAANGAMLGAIFGSAFGGITHGPRGHDIGTMVGMVGGAIVGAAAGSAFDKKKREIIDSRMERAKELARQRQLEEQGNDDGSGFDPDNGGDDRITFDPTTPGEYPAGEHDPDAVATNRHATYSTVTPRTVSLDQLSQMAKGSGLKFKPLMEICNASFVDNDGDGIITRGETCRISFEIMNRSQEPMTDIMPIVADTTANPHLRISQPLRIERIAPGRGVRYTATVTADNRLKDGMVVIKVGATQGRDGIAAQVQEFCIPTRKSAGNRQ